jgi:hypothetical protein
MATRIRELGWTYSCPACGTYLDQFDVDKAPEDYSCTFCCTQVRPSRVADRAGWEFPD